jgi:methylenetetrahydrofolate dehydrogenase (NADP+) / methenyltetrahydrofolate cyclohydrolase
VAKIVDGNALSRELRQEIADQIAAIATATGIPARVAIVQIGDDAAASMYTRRLQRTFSDANVNAEIHQFAEAVSQAEIETLLRVLSEDEALHGIQIQTPLPPQLDMAGLLAHLDPRKDVDGIHPENAGRLAQGRPAIVPATPAGGLEILLRHQVPLEGARAVVVGRSTTVGRPMALLLIQHNATVTVCHTRTRDLAGTIREAEVVAVAAGRAGLVTADMIRPGAAVVDFGVNFVDGKTVGDVDPAAAEVAGLFTPVPGGTGPVTNAMLLKNTLTIYRSATGGEPQ